MVAVRRKVERRRNKDSDDRNDCTADEHKFPGRECVADKKRRSIHGRECERIGRGMGMRDQ